MIFVLYPWDHWHLYCLYLQQLLLYIMCSKIKNVRFVLLLNKIILNAENVNDKAIFILYQFFVLVFLTSLYCTVQSDERKQSNGLTYVYCIFFFFSIILECFRFRLLTDEIKNKYRPWFFYKHRHGVLCVVLKPWSKTKGVCMIMAGESFGKDTFPCISEIKQNTS